jgi:hypothetical protein
MDQALQRARTKQAASKLSSSSSSAAGDRSGLGFKAALAGDMEDRARQLLLLAAVAGAGAAFGAFTTAAVFNLISR